MGVESAQQVLLGLEGEVVAGWSGIEMCLRERDDGTFVFEDPTAPFRQMSVVDIDLGTRRLRVGTVLDGIDWGLWLWPAPDVGSEVDGFYRSVADLGAPVGQVEAVTLVEEAGLVAEVGLVIGGRPLLLVAGEVEEGWDGSLSITRPDESVLVFHDPADADRVPWIPPRILGGSAAG